MTQSPRSAEAEPSAIWDVGLIFAVSAFAPLMVVVDASEKPRLLTFSFVVVLVGLTGCVIWWGLTRFGFGRRGSAYGVASFTFVVMNVGSLVMSGDVGRGVLIAGGLVIAVLAYRLAQYRWVQGLATWSTLFLLVYPLALLGEEVLSSENVTVATSPDIDVAGMVSKPDIVMVVLDAYGGSRVLADLYGYDNGAIVETLRGRGFDVPLEVTANYGRTQLSIPTVLQLNYVAGEQVITEDDIHSLLGVLGGDSKLASALQEHGYRTVQIESGWLGSRCGPRVDVCVGSPWPDETFYDAAYRSILVGLPGFELGRPFTQGALNGMNWLENDLHEFLDDGIPDFILAHVLLPHPPLFLDSECTPDWRGGADGFAIGRIGYDDLETARVRDLYVQQIQCANALMTRTTSALGEDDVMVIVGDHGPDSQGQLFLQSTDWTAEQRDERFGTFMAARVPGCDMDEVASLVNVGRRMMSCLTSENFPDLPTRIYDIHKTRGETRVVELVPPVSTSAEEAPNG